jgi:hypothetical protein
VTSKPNKLPQWVWEEYVDQMEETFPWDAAPHMPPDDDDSAVARVLKDDGCSIVWNAIKRRAAKFSSTSIESATTGHASSLISIVRDAAAGPAPLEEATETERVRGERIANLAEKLAKELKALQLSAPNHHFPREIHDSLGDFGVVVHRYRQRQKNREIPPRSIGVKWYVQGSSDEKEVAHKYLRALARGARAWSQGTSVVKRYEGSTHPARLYFVRKVSTYFRSTYGTPLHDSTAALARAVYQSEISGATVAKLT